MGGAAKAIRQRGRILGSRISPSFTNPRLHAHNHADFGATRVVCRLPPLIADNFNFSPTRLAAR